MRGPKPKPTKLKVLHGNPGRRPLNDREPAPAPHSLEPPAWIDGDALAEWRRLAPLLHRLGLLTEIDEQALTSYCQTWARWKAAELQIRKHGMVLRGKGGFPVISPYVAVANRSLAHLKQLLAEFGMTPAARTRVKTEAGPAPEDPFARFDHGTIKTWKP